METLRLVQIVCRHGARSNHFIRETYPGDVNSAELAKLGVSGLTKQGRIQMYELGKYLRERYHFFLQDDLSSIYARSSDFDRCIDSASCILTAMFPPKDKLHQIDPELNWQPVPVHTESSDRDTVLYSIKAHGVVGELFQKELPSEIQGYKKKIEEATKMTIKDMFSLGPLCDQILLEVASQMSVPPAILTVIPEAKKVLKYYQDYMMEGDRKKEFGGGLLRCIAEKIELVRSKTDDKKEVLPTHHPRKPKAFLYLTSDFIVFPLMKLLGIEEDIPNFGVTFILEVHEIKGQLIVRMFYNNDTMNNPSKFRSHQITSTTPFDCPIEVFLNFTQQLL